MSLTIINILFSLVTVISGFGLGRLISKCIINGDKSKFEAFVINTGFGLGFLSIIHFIFASVKGFKTPAIYGLFAIIVGFFLYGAFFIVKDIISTMKRAGVNSKSKEKRQYSKFDVFMLALMLVGLVLTFVNALAPSLSDDWDSLAYHLSAPKLFLENGGFYYINFSSHTNFPMLQEILYVPAIYFNLPVAAKLLHFYFAILTILMVGYTISRHFAKSAVVWGSLIVFSMPIYLWLATTAYIDITIAFYSVLGLYFVLGYIDSKNYKDLLACGVACGFAASTKMLGFQFIFLFSLWILIDGLVKYKKFDYKGILWIVVPSIIICAGWYIKSIIYTGNPVYPFFYGMFGGKDWNPELAQLYAYKQALFGVGHDIRSFIVTPLYMSIKPELFYDQPGLFIGPVLMVVFPCMCLLLQVKNRKLAGLALVIFLQYVIWFMLTQQSRYLLPMFVFSAVFIPAILGCIKGGNAVKGLLMSFFVISSIFGILIMFNTANTRYPVVNGSWSVDQYLTRYFKPYEADKFVNSLTDKNVKVALFGDTEGFYLNKPYVWGDYGHNTIFTHKYKNVDEFISDLKKNKITHIIVPFGKAPPTIGLRQTAEDTNLQVFTAIEKGKVRQVFPNIFSSSRVFVYEVL